MMRYKIYIIADEGHDGRNKTRAIIKLKTKYKTRDIFIECIINSKHKPAENIQNEVSSMEIMLQSNFNAFNTINVVNSSVPKLKLNNIPSSFENTSTRSRNIPNNIYNLRSDISTQPMNKQLYYTSERLGGLDNHKSIGSTICRDVEGLDNEIIPVKKKLGRNPQTYRINNPNNYHSVSLSHNGINFNNITPENIIEEEKVISRIENVNITDNKILREDSFNYRSRIEDQSQITPKEVQIKVPLIKDERMYKDIKVVKEIQLENISKESQNGLRIESKKYDYSRYLCCKY